MKILLFMFIISVVFSSCTTGYKYIEEERVLNKTLILIELDSVRLPENEKTGEIYIRLNSEGSSKGSVTGFSGCNDIYGSYKGSYEGIPKFKLELTDKFCGKADLEKRLVELLGNIQSIEFTKPKGKNDTIAYFFAASPEHRGLFKVMK